ncbi:hypothetical protein CO654_15615 [Rhizobium sp. L18]|nr:hypothetical protein CO654_15615 [Rhizobium sp. L18]
MSCRTSPPQGGRSASGAGLPRHRNDSVKADFDNPMPRQYGRRAAVLSISPLVGEMSGRTEGGATRAAGPADAINQPNAFSS